MLRPMQGTWILPFFCAGLLTAQQAESSLLKPPPLSPEEQQNRATPTVRAVQKAAPSVVNVYVHKGTGIRTDTPFGDVGARFALEGQGSGVIIDQSGLTLTNWHVVASALDKTGRQSPTSKVELTLVDGRKFVARVLSVVESEDLALLHAEVPEGEKIQPVVIGDSDSLLRGEPTIAIGNPFGLDSSVSVGVLSAVNRTVTVMGPDKRPRSYKGLLQTDAAINPGNSGGALIDINGRLIGINNAKRSDIEGVGYAIPVTTVRRVFREQLLSGDRLRGVFVGIAFAEDGAATQIATLEPNGPAARAGLVVGDTLIAVDGKPVASGLDFARLLLSARAGTPFAVRYSRGGTEADATIEPWSHAQWSLARRTGLHLETLALQDAGEDLRKATLAMHREHTGDEQSEPTQWLERTMRVVTVLQPGESPDEGPQPGDLLLAVEVVVPGPSFDTMSLVTFDTEDLADETLKRLVDEKKTTAKFWLYRDGKIRIVRHTLRKF